MKSERIKELTIEITNRCPFNCIHCSADASSNRKKFMSLKKVDSILNEGLEEGFGEVRFSGGEPLLHSKLSKMLSIAKECEYKTTLLTSGNVLTAENRIVSPYVGFLKEYIFTYLDSIYFSLHGSCKLQSFVTNTNSSLTMENMLNIKKFSDFFYSDNNLWFHSVIFNETDEEDVDFLCSLNTNIHLLKLVHQGRAVKYPNMDLVHELKILKLFKEKLKIGRLKYTNSFEGQRCNISKKKVFDIKGNSYPCSALKYFKDQYNYFECENHEVIQ